MKTPLFLVLALGAGAIAGGSTALLLGDSPTGSAGPAPVTPARDAELQSRIEALAEENRSLRARLAELELRPVPAVRAPVGEFVSWEDFELFREELLALIASSGPAPTVPVAFEDQVADALSAIRKREAVAAVRAKQERRAAKLEQDLVHLAARLELSPYQVDGVRTALLSQFDREAELRRLWEEGADDELLGERKRSDREALQGDLSLVLSSEQLEMFWDRGGQGGK